MKVKLRSTTIDAHLARRNKSKSWLALKIGISSAYLSQLMDGTRNPSPKVREQIQRTLPDLSFDDLFTLSIKQEGET